MGIALLVVTGFLLGGAYSFARSRTWIGVGILGAAAVLAGVAAFEWLR